MIYKILIIGLGGFIGAISRYLLYITLKPFDMLGVNVSILTINILGCFLLGIANSFFGEKSDSYSLFICTGILGAFTTFSTFSLEAIDLLSDKKYAESLIYISLSVILGIIGFALGQKLYQVITR